MNEYHFISKCKAKDLNKSLTFAWYGIGNIWQFDETDNELIWEMRQ